MTHNANEDARDGVVTVDSRSGGNDWDVLFVPNTIRSIRESAYRGATNIRVVQCEDGDSPLTIYEGAFEGCVSLQVVELPGRVETIQDRSFAVCTSLGDFRIVGDSHLHSLGHGLNVFDGCPNADVFKQELDDEHAYRQAGVQSDFRRCQQEKVIRFGDGFAKRSEMNLLFGLNPGAGMRQGSASLRPVGREAIIWWPNYPCDNDNWVDVKEELGPATERRGYQEILQISEMNRDPSENERHIKETLETPRSQERYVFWHEARTGECQYKFYGVYKLMREKTIETGKCWFERIATEAKIG